MGRLLQKVRQGLCALSSPGNEEARLIAWDQELASTHQRLRQALGLIRGELSQRVEPAEPRPGGAHQAAAQDLLLYCQGFCVALRGHHLSEDDSLFPVLSARHPSLATALAKLGQDHQMMATLIGQFEQVLTSTAEPDELTRHIDGLTAIMESHFRYEERELRSVLAQLELHADPHTVLGPL